MPYILPDGISETMLRIVFQGGDHSKNVVHVMSCQPILLELKVLRSLST